MPALLWPELVLPPRLRAAQQAQGCSVESFKINKMAVAKSPGSIPVLFFFYLFIFNFYVFL